MTLEGIMGTKTSQTQKDEHCRVPLEQSNAWRQREEQWLPEARGRRGVPLSTDFQFGMMESSGGG